MNLLQLKQQVLHQTGSDADELGEQAPQLLQYLNEGYDRMVLALYGVHVEEAGDYPPLFHDKSVPDLPLWAQRSLADYAAWMVYRNGPAARQSRGYIYRKAFDEAVCRARMERGGQRFANLPK